MRVRIPFLVALAALVGPAVAPAAASAQDEAPPASLPPETAGNWRFKSADRPVKAVVVGGSVAAWPKGSFSQFLEAACPRTEIVNRAKEKLGAQQLNERFRKQVLQNRRLRLADHEETWLVFLGGLNSIGTPEMTNRWVARTLREAKANGIRTIGLTVGPWGSEQDRRWKGARGLEYRRMTKLAVDFVMGRLTPFEAFGPGHERDEYAPGELPEIAVDLYDSPLRDASADPRPEGRLPRLVAADPWVRTQVRDLPPDEKDSRLAALVEEAREIPRWFLRRELHAFDHIHPKMEGHRIIAETTCPKLPASWGCRCDAIATMSWDPKTGLTPRVAGP